jgi:deoxycytidylate deaminase
MEAISACARSGRSVRGTDLYTTTFPCHNCCRHIIGAGIRKVVYIEPYAKSKASILHKDEVSIDHVEDGKLPFLSFLGVGPRRYFDLFSLKLSTGYPIERKKDGKHQRREISRDACDTETQEPHLLGSNGKSDSSS